MELDLRSVFVVGTVVSSIIGLLMFFIARAQKSHTYLNVVSKGFLALAASGLLMAMRGYISDFASIIIGNALVALWILLMWHGVRVMYHRSSPWQWSLAILIGFEALIAYYTYVEADINVRIILSSLYVALYSALAARELMLDRSKGGEHIFTATVLVAYSVMMLARAQFTLVTPASADYMSVEISHQLSIFLTIAVDVGLAIGFLWIWQRKLERQLQDRATALVEVHRLTDQLRRDAEKAALLDPLTGAGNRRKFTTMATVEHERHARYDRALSFAFLDVDHFKDINDRFGHEAGDEVLRNLVACVSDITRNIDMVFRWGGEEFAVLLPETNLSKAEYVCQRIRQAVEVKLAIGEVPVTVSIGVAQMQDGESLADLSGRADDYMYQAKKNGRNCIFSG